MDISCECGTADEAYAAVLKEVKALTTSGHCDLWILQLASIWQAVATATLTRMIEEFPMDNAMPKDLQVAIAQSMINKEAAKLWNRKVKDAIAADRTKAN